VEHVCNIPIYSHPKNNVHHIVYKKVTIDRGHHMVVSLDFEILSCFNFHFVFFCIISVFGLAHSLVLCFSFFCFGWPFNEHRPRRVITSFCIFTHRKANSIFIHSLPLFVSFAAFLWLCGTQMYLVAPLENLQNTDSNGGDER